MNNHMNGSPDPTEVERIKLFDRKHFEEGAPDGSYVLMLQTSNRWRVGVALHAGMTVAEAAKALRKLADDLDATIAAGPAVEAPEPPRIQLLS